MRKSFLLYLFVFTALLAVFMYVTGQKMLESKEHKIEQLQEELVLAENRSDSLFSEISSKSHSFTLKANEEALSYLENRGFIASEIAEKVESELINGNKADADNALVPYVGMDGFFRINKVELINHKWILASFTDGTYWGELFLTYEIEDDGKIEVQSEKALIYPKG